MKFKLTLIAALSLLTCPVINCGVFSKLATSARVAFTHPTFSFKSFAPKATLFAGALSTYQFFKPAVVRADNQQRVLTQIEKDAIVNELCPKRVDQVYQVTCDNTLVDPRDYLREEWARKKRFKDDCGCWSYEKKLLGEKTVQGLEDPLCDVRIYCGTYALLNNELRYRVRQQYSISSRDSKDLGNAMVQYLQEKSLADGYAAFVKRIEANKKSDDSHNAIRMQYGEAIVKAIQSLNK